MATSVLGAADVQDLTSQIPKDSISTILGNKDGQTYCGKRQFKITSMGHSDYLSYDGTSFYLTLSSSKETDVGSNI